MVCGGALVPALPWDLVLVLLGSWAAALQGQDTALERKARAGWVGRCHTQIGFPQRGLLPSCRAVTKALTIGLCGPSLPGYCKAVCRGTLRRQVSPTLLTGVTWLSCSVVQLLSALLMRTVRAPSPSFEKAAPLLLWRPPVVQRKLSAGKFYRFNFF